MAHGTPSSMDEMPAYLTLVRGGRAPSAELVNEMVHNYEAIGGRSPLTDITLAQAAALQQRLGHDYDVAGGVRDLRPYIAEAMAALTDHGVRRIVGIPMAPQFSTLSVEKYERAARAALPADMPFDAVRSFHAHPLLIRSFAERVHGAAPASDEEIIFSAHALPVRVIEAGDRYADEVAATARGVAAAVGIGTYHLAYQSAGRTPEPWIGPDLGDLIRERAAAGARRFLVVPIGFVCDHTEILFDIDVQASAAARDAGATLRRTESLNTLPTFIEMLDDIVRRSVPAPAP